MREGRPRGPGNHDGTIIPEKASVMWWTNITAHLKRQEGRPQRVRAGGPRLLRIDSSPAFVRMPEGNGCAERFIRALKEQPLWIRSFDVVE